MKQNIRVCDVEKYYGNGNQVTKAVDRVSFQVEQGEFVGVMGASGSGKSTLLNLLSTIDQVTAGHIYYGDTDITELTEDELSRFRKDNLGFVFQEYNLLDTLTLEENIILAMTLHKGSRRQIQKKCDQIMRLLGIDGIRDQFPYQVSGGRSSVVPVQERWSMIPVFCWQMSLQERWIPVLRRHFLRHFAS